jgi:hypothetical protein
VKFIKLSEMNGQEKYELERQKKEAQTMVAEKRKMAEQEVENVTNREQTAKMLAGNAENARTLADKIRLDASVAQALAKRGEHSVDVDYLVRLQKGHADGEHGARSTNTLKTQPDPRCKICPYVHGTSAVLNRQPDRRD